MVVQEGLGLRLRFAFISFVGKSAQKTFQDDVSHSVIKKNIVSHLIMLSTRKDKC